MLIIVIIEIKTFCKNSVIKTLSKKNIFPLSQQLSKKCNLNIDHSVGTYIKIYV